MNAALQVLLVEDDELFRLGLRVGLQQDANLEIVGEATDGETAVQMAKQLALDVVLLDIGLPGIGGLEACRQIKQHKPTLPILVLTSRFQKSLIARLIEAGVQGYCMKGIEAKALILAIRSVAMGASWWDQPVTAEIRSAFQASQSDLASTSEAAKATNSVNLLTKREQETLSLMAQGKNNHEIADTLYISPGTVRVHVHAILQKLEVRDRTQAVIVALQNNLIPI
jgi:two-component system, NarL family, response regulator